MTETVLAHLRALVAADTQNPPRAITGSHPLFVAVRAALPAGFTITVEDHGAGCVSLLAVRGTPRVLFNFHVDTVPVAPGWSRNPHELHVGTTRATGLGAADIKGAAACMLHAVNVARGDVALLFTSDEEAGNSTCVRAFTAHHAAGWQGVIVAEPTRARAVTAHRGIATCTGHFTGTPGHASLPRVLVDSAVHEMVRWGSAALALAQSEEGQTYGALRGTRLNLGAVEGGQKPNMIAGEARVRVGVRPLPARDPSAELARYQALAPDASRVRWERGFTAPPLPLSADMETRARDLAAALGLPAGDAVDFWTEAALFSQAGMPAVVFGPGDIAQAHTADEWVSLDELDACTDAYVRILSAA